MTIRQKTCNIRLYSSFGEPLYISTPPPLPKKNKKQTKTKQKEKPDHAEKHVVEYLK